MAEEHDRTHRLIFAFPRMVEDLIRLVLGGEWIQRLDFSTLQKVPERLLSPELLRREEDVLWRVAYRCPEEEGFDWFFVYLHVEHQSRPRRKMSLYTTAYKLLALQDFPDAPEGLDLWSYKLVDARRYPLEEVLGGGQPPDRTLQAGSGPTMDRIIRNIETKSEARAESNLFQELFAARFGEIPDWARQRIADAKKGQLVTWAKRLLTSERPEDVFD